MTPQSDQSENKQKQYISMAAPVSKIKFVENMDSLGLKTDSSKINFY